MKAGWNSHNEISSVFVINESCSFHSYFFKLSFKIFLKLTNIIKSIILNEFIFTQCLVIMSIIRSDLEINQINYRHIIVKM